MALIPEGATIWARQTIQSDIFKIKPDKWFKIWFYLVNKVNHENNKQFKRGSGFMKYEWIIENTGATKNQIDHSMRWFKKERMLATQKATRGFIVTILKYETFQDLNNYKSDTKSDLKATQKRHKSDTINNNDNNDNNVNNINKNIVTKKSKQKEPPNPDVNIFLENFKEQFLHYRGVEYIIPDSDYGAQKKLIKVLLKKISISELKERCIAFFKNDAWAITKSNYSLYVFSREINRCVPPKKENLL